MKKIIHKNVGELERILRIVIGLGLAVMGLTGKIGVLGLAGGIFLTVSGTINSCLLYSILRINTRKKEGISRHQGNL